DFLQLLAFQKLHIADARRRPQVVHDGVSFVEPFRRDDVLVINTFVFVTGSGAITMEPDVMLPRHFAKFLVIRHCRILLLKLNQLLTLPLSSYPKGEATIWAAHGENATCASVRLSPLRGED